MIFSKTMKDGKKSLSTFIQPRPPGVIQQLAKEAHSPCLHCQTNHILCCAVSLSPSAWVVLLKCTGLGDWCFSTLPPFSPMCYCNIPTNLDSSTLLLVTHTIHTKLYLLYSLHWFRLRLALIPTRFLTPSILWSMIHLDLDIEMCQRLVPSFSPCTDAILPHVHPVCVICTQIIANN